MKNVILLILLALSSSVLLAQQHTRAISFKSERDKNGNIVITAKNEDFCDYYISLNIEGDYEVRGNFRGQVISRKSDKIVATLVKNGLSSGGYNYSSRTYRGSLNKKINPGHVYALPVKPGDSIQYIPARNRAFTSVFNLKFAGDTVYACRGGVVCDDRLTDTANRTLSKDDKIIIYHEDGTFGQYSKFQKVLVYPGESVSVGQPIAIVKPGDNERKLIHFSVFFLDKNMVNNDETGIKHSNLVPVFHSLNSGDGKLEEKTTYVSELTDELIMQDMSKKERAKYLKKKEQK
ncbi:peptidoglycan DD-metalloendopeptidase family protein [Dysgonomonas sp. 511]|uniref:peptidoglycan DD-metalloendopeptidase family protein n=1 Tax=Dysgonomonas sp. 511 TaxID=2302930 RepID=UPI0013D2D128|nr:peptidoglycan DD-metalloendopeptidase family protein [Dysgonomonas sp. 511]NDV79389.1 hypothetical protein [Dysgonomonas sp. 511]